MKLRSFLNSVVGYVYDLSRYLRHSSCLGVANLPQRSYRLSKIYHSLEKSLSFRERRPGAGRASAESLALELTRWNWTKEPPTSQARVAVRVLTEFTKTDEASVKNRAVQEVLAGPSAIHAAERGGIDLVTAAYIRQGLLANPENFFKSRRSVRDFRSVPVEEGLIDKAIQLASTAPSACNRQPWHVYSLHERQKIDEALSLQNGNRGFGHEVQTLLIVAADLAAFDSGSERYQHWIDGGMFSMNLILALHSLGVSSCCLNWSKGPRHDLALRRILPIAPSHSVLMMLAIGYPSDTIKVCASPRRPLQELRTRL